MPAAIVPEDTKVVRGVTFRRDPARDASFTVAQLPSELHDYADMSDIANRQRLHRHMHNEMQNLEIVAQSLADFPDEPEYRKLAHDYELERLDARFQGILQLVVPAVQKLVTKDTGTAWFEHNDRNARHDLRSEGVKDLTQVTLSRIKKAKVVKRTPAAESRFGDLNFESEHRQAFDGGTRDLRMKVVVERVGPEQDLLSATRLRFAREEPRFERLRRELRDAALCDSPGVCVTRFTMPGQMEARRDHLSIQPKA